MFSFQKEEMTLNHIKAHGALYNLSAFDKDSAEVIIELAKKFKTKLYFSNIISANIINLYNAVIFLISINYISNSQVQIFLILLNLFLYTAIYFKIYFYKLKNLL